MAIQPLDDRIIVQPDIAEDRTASGIYLPEGAKEKPMTGKVVVTGPGTLSDDGSRAKVCVKKGDKVLYGKYSGTEVEVDGKTLMIMSEGELLGVIEK